MIERWPHMDLPNVTSREQAERLRADRHRRGWPEQAEVPPSRCGTCNWSTHAHHPDCPARRT